MLYSTIWAVVLTITGLWLSYVFDLPSGATIVLVLAVVFFIISILKKKFIPKLKSRATINSQMKQGV